MRERGSNMTVNISDRRHPRVPRTNDSLQYSSFKGPGSERISSLGNIIGRSPDSDEYSPVTEGQRHARPSEERFPSTAVSNSMKVRKGPM